MSEELDKIESAIDSAVYSIRREIEDLGTCVEKFQDLKRKEIQTAWYVLIHHGIIPGSRFRLITDKTQTYKVIGIFPNGFVFIDEAKPELRREQDAIKAAARIDLFEAVK